MVCFLIKENGGIITPSFNIDSSITTCDEISQREPIRVLPRIMVKGPMVISGPTRTELSI